MTTFKLCSPVFVLSVYQSAKVTPDRRRGFVRPLILHWQGWEFWNQTFDDDVGCDVEEIRHLIDGNDGSGS
jgi:hypothetical protein